VTAWSSAGFAAVAELVAERAGLTFPESRRAATESDMKRAMEEAEETSLSAYLARLERDPRLFDALLDLLTVGETYFFRHPQQFEAIRQSILPEVRARRGPGHPLRAWSAACASGEEAYSLAILFEEEGLGPEAHVLGTDVSRRALFRARQATYGAWSFRGTSDALKQRHFLHKDGCYALRPALKDRVRIEYLNLMADAYPSVSTGTWAMDLILCRNVFIYFPAQVVEEVARRLLACLGDGGWLVTAASDPLLGEMADFDVVTTPAGLFYRRHLQRRSVVVPPSAPRPWPMLSATADKALPPPAAAAPRPEAAHRIQETATREGPLAAEKAARAEAARHPLVPEAHFLLAMMLLDQGREGEALEAARRALYLDRSLAVVHFVIGRIQRRTGDADGAARAFRNARDLAAARPPEESLPLSEGERAAALAEAAAAELALLETEPDGTRSVAAGSSSLPLRRQGGVGDR
jgi:chemotaxis protein methyltransferase CheR